MNSEPELEDQPWLRLQRGIYYTLERWGFELLKLIGIQWGAQFTKLGIITLGEPKPEYLDQLSSKLSSSLGLELIYLGNLEPSMDSIQWNSYIFVPKVLNQLIQRFGSAREMGLLGISWYKLSVLPPLNLFRLLQRFYLILGIANPWLKIALVTTLQNKLQRDFFIEICLHEVGHLMGKHGYPMYA